MTDPRRELPSVDHLLREPEVASLLADHPRTVVVDAVRNAIEAARKGRGAPPEDWGIDVRERLLQSHTTSLRPVINATGVVLHTNLGRAPLAPAARAAMLAVAEGYCTLEYALPTGSRGQRADHCRRLLAELTGAEDGLVVNNAAGALVAALNAVARGKKVLISRGELIEIGGSFRIPEIIEQSGTELHEVGTTNRTHLRDYEKALPGAAAILSVHRSNFVQWGFVASALPADIAELAHKAGIPYLHDVGSGLLADLSNWGLTTEPRVPDAVAAGADLVIFSGDKLLGGPQAGCIVGRAALVELCRTNPFARAVRADKLTLAALEATLALYRDPARAIAEIPTLAMLTLAPEELRHRAEQLAGQLPGAFEPRLTSGQSAAGGGSFPGAVFPTTLVSLASSPMGPNGLALRLRRGDPPVIARVEKDRVVLDPRTIPVERFGEIAACLSAILAG
jgi:L-seryl-tRNA(Ser) seleniumtransferase